jgi:hypothetical protein
MDESVWFERIIHRSGVVIDLAHVVYNAGSAFAIVIVIQRSDVSRVPQIEPRYIPLDSFHRIPKSQNLRVAAHNCRKNYV